MSRWHLIKKAAPMVDDQHRGRRTDGRTDGYDRAQSDQEQERERERTRKSAAAAKQTKIASSGRLSGLVYFLLGLLRSTLHYLTHLLHSLLATTTIITAVTTTYYCHPQMGGYIRHTFLRWMRHGIIQTRGTSGRHQFASFDLIVLKRKQDLGKGSWAWIGF